jgi:hypothetical protein
MMMRQTTTRFNNYRFHIVCEFTEGFELIVAFVEAIVSVETDAFFVDLRNSGKIEDLELKM